MRLDKFLQTEFGLRSRTYAENLILRGRVAVNGRQILKPAADVAESDKVEILSDEDYASQGAYKIEEAHRVFGFAVSGLDCADIGCSNGGFTDFLLRHGAKSVLAVEAVVLVKPQFEAGKRALSKKGIVLSEKDRLSALESVKSAARECGFEVLGVTPTKVSSSDKNTEYLLYLCK